MQGAKEVEIQVDLVVARAIERPHGRAGEAAGGLDAAGEEHQAGFLIGAAEAILEYPVPHRLGVGENHGDEVAQGLVLRRSEEHTTELQSLMRISYAVFCLQKKTYIRSRRTSVSYKNS